MRTRRARLNPAEAGLPEYGRRRVPGLRREEVAQLAGVSVDYYVRLEQGRSPSASDAVLDAIARALRLDDTERAHLRNLVRPVKSPRIKAGPQRVRQGLHRVVELMTHAPAFVLGHRMDVLAWNDLADAVLGFSTWTRRNAAYQAFLDPAARGFYREWPRVAAETVAVLRLSAGRRPDDPQLAALVGELSMKDDLFRELWARHEVKEKTFGRKLLRHPIVGDLDLAYETLAPAGDAEQMLVVFTAAAGSASAERLGLLASWTATAPDTVAH